MAPEALREIAWERMLTSQANVLYYQGKVDWWSRADAVVRFIAAITASTTLIAFASKWAPWISTSLGLLATLGSITSATLKVPDKVAGLSVLLVEYVGHQNTFERLYRFGSTEAEMKRALEVFGETEKREAKDHPKPNEKEMAESQELVKKRLGLEAA